MKNALIIVGSAPCVIDDAARLPAGDYDYMAIGLDAIGKVAAPIKFVATYHPDDIPMILERIAVHPVTIIGYDSSQQGSRFEHDGEKYVVPYEPPTGSSAMLGAFAGMKMGYTKIILCGCPLEGVSSGGTKYTTFRAGWEAKKDRVKDVVRSMSGWTREFLGEPTEEWLNKQGG